MKEKVNQLIQVYRVRLQRKEKIFQPYKDMNNNLEYKMSELEYATFKTLQAEIQQFKNFIEELEYILEE
jgi:hypothetical protein